ncbi:MAG: hypothetical protein JWM82_108 [Myxococcales bacterium]|nr:hypothetical protein [Myxococcales bacterium]
MDAARPKHNALNYRPDVDGLRAVAVLLVLLYHLGIPVRGGFVGVDVFFVISGFLIGSIILNDLALDRFTFAGFYERRIRRIFPALVVLLAAASVLAYRYLMPAELGDFAKSLLSANLSASNFYFWQQSGYFDAAANSKPLLHTWSLAVEEQFYIGLPVLLVLLKRRAPQLKTSALFALALASLALGIWGAYRYPTATFFLAPGRAWELLLGTIVSLESVPRPRSPLARNLAGAGGLAMILGSGMLYNDGTVFPGLAALVPCVGAALVIAAGREGPNVAGRLLSLKPLTFVGLISYSLYLWHWPLIVYTHFGMTPVGGLTRHQSQLFVFSLSIVLAVLSWRLVEVPFRQGIARRLSRAQLFGLAAGSVACIAILSGAAIAKNGFPERFPPEARRIMSYDESHAGHNQYRIEKCFMTGRDWPFEAFDAKDCLAEQAGKPKLLILGDSHAAHLWWGLNLVYPDWSVLQATSSGCKPVLEQRPRQHPGCTRLMTYMLKTYLASHHVDTLVLEAHWEMDDLPSLSATLEWLRSLHVHVVLLGPTLQYDSPLPRLLAMSIRANDPSIPQLHRLPTVSALDERMADLAKTEWHTPYVSMVGLLCDGPTCLQFAGDDIPLLSDYGHFTEEGSVLVAKKLRDSGALAR